MSELKVRRILVKFSGEALMGSLGSGIDPSMVDRLSAELIELKAAGAEIGIVVGGGNLFRGAALAAAGLDRVTGDHMGMLATVMNALALKDSLIRGGANALVMSGLDMPQVCERYTQRVARQHIAAGDIVLFAAGTGSPYFTTDTAAVLRAIEIEADLMIKATKVDGVYNRDPVKFADAVRYDSLEFDQAINERLGVMDMAAMTLANDNALSLVVCDINRGGALMELIQGQAVGTRVIPKEVKS